MWKPSLTHGHGHGHGHGHELLREGTEQCPGEDAGAPARLAPTTYLLGPEGLSALEGFATRDVLVALDFDGTLSPICMDPGAARLPPATAALLRRVCELYDCAVVSGRAYDDVVQRLDGADVALVVGNHGLEPWEGSPAIEEMVGRWRRSLTAALADHAGVLVEDKRFSLAIHFRNAQDPPAARRAIRQAVADLGPLRALGGKQVLNLLPEGTGNKGTAVERFRDQLGRDRVIYVGDDLTDEDVFALGAPWLLGVRVGLKAESSARFHLRAQREIDQLLTALVEIAERIPLGSESPPCEQSATR